MVMEKRGVVDDATPTDREKRCCGGACRREPATKEAADLIEDNAATRLAEAAADASRRAK